MISFPVILINSLSVLMISILIISLWQKRSETSASQMIALSLFMLIWAIGSFVEMAVSDFSQKIIWRNITQIGVFFTPAATLIFSMTYSGILSKYKKQIGYFIYAIQTSAILFIMTDQWHHFARSSVYIVKNGLYETLIVHPTLLTQVMISLNFLYMITSFIILITFAFHTTKGMRKQVFCILFGMSICILYSLLKVSSGEQFGMMIPISGVFALADLSMVLGVTRYDLLRTAPIARNDVFYIMDDGIIITSINGKIIDVNPAALQIFGYDSSTEVTFQSLQQYIHQTFSEWHTAMVQGSVQKFNISRDNDTGTKFYICDTYAVTNKKNKTIGSISVIKDITEEKRRNDLLRQRAEQDGLTGINNRYTFIERVESILKEHDGDVCLLFFDIDFFKKVNDSYGHICGDFILKELCKHIQTILGEDSIIGRMGGEEFAIVLKSKNRQQTLQAAENLRSSVDEHNFQFENQTIHITISIGAAIGQNMSFDELYRLADSNLYLAKESGRNCLRH